jgi:hypothetical protein
MKYFILKNLQEMANDFEKEIIAENLIVTFIIPHYMYILQGLF